MATKELVKHIKNQQGKNLVVKSLLGSNLPVRLLLYKYLFNLKFETGSYRYFLKYKNVYTWENKISQHLGSSLETQVSYHSSQSLLHKYSFGMQIIYKE